MNELTKTLNITLPSINIDKDELAKYQQAIQADADEVRQHNVTADGLADDKKYRTYVNKKINGTIDNRKALTKQIMAVKKQLTDTVNDMLLPLVEAHKELDNKIKAIEQAERNDKRLRIYHQIIEPMYISRGLDPHKAVINDKWLNSSTSHNQILKDVANYADIALAEAKRNGSSVNSHGMIINSYGEPTNINARKAVITYYGDAEALENKLKELDKNVNVIDVDFE